MIKTFLRRAFYGACVMAVASGIIVGAMILLNYAPAMVWVCLAILIAAFIIGCVIECEPYDYYGNHLSVHEYQEEMAARLASFDQKGSTDETQS